MELKAHIYSFNAGDSQPILQVYRPDIERCCGLFSFKNSTIMNTANSQAAHWSLLTKDLDVDYFFRGEGIFHVAHPETSFSAQEVVEDKYRNTLLQRDEYLISTHHGQGLAIMYWYDLEF